MVPVIIAGGVAFLGIVALIEDYFKKDPEFSEIEHHAIALDFFINQDKEKLDEKYLKQRITKTINKIAKNHKNFKIGKTGDPKKRTVSSDYKEYEKIFVLCSSKDADLIKDLEAYYTSKYIDHKNNNNIRKGSANKSVAAQDNHYLYIAVI